MGTDEWRVSVNNRLDSMEKDLSELKTQSAVDEVHRKNVEKRLSSIENTLVWLVRLVLGAIIIAAVTGGINVLGA